MHFCCFIWKNLSIERNESCMHLKQKYDPKKCNSYFNFRDKCVHFELIALVQLCFHMTVVKVKTKVRARKIGFKCGKSDLNPTEIGYGCQEESHRLAFICVGKPETS